MKKLFITFIILLLFSLLSYAQVPRFVKYNVSDSGASMYFPGEPNWEKTLSEDESAVYTANVKFNNINYGAIVVKLLEPVENVELVLEKYLEYLNDNYFMLTKNTDIGKGLTLEKYPDVKGLLEYGENAEGEKYTVKCWGNKSILSVLFINSKDEVNQNYQEMFFKGFRFPTDKE